MSLRILALAVVLLSARSGFAQDPAVINMDREPHHHLALEKSYVKVFDVRVSPGDSIVMHRHDQDTVAIAIGDQLVTVGIPGKPDVHQKNSDAQVRLQRSGYMHSTRVDGDSPYHTVAVEFLWPQTNFHNVCAEVLVGQPLNCATSAKKDSAEYASEPLLESAESQVLLVRLHPHQTMMMRPADVMDSSAAAVIVALDAVQIPAGPGKGPIRLLRPGDFDWMGRGYAREYENLGDKDARLVKVVFSRAE